MRIVVNNGIGGTFIFENGQWHAQPRPMQNILNNLYHPSIFSGAGGDGGLVAVQHLKEIFPNLHIVTLENAKFPLENVRGVTI